MTALDTCAAGGCTLASCNLDGMSSPRIYYDGDGNMECITTRTGCDAYAGRSYGWTSFDMVESVASGANTASLAYTPEHARGSQTVAGVANSGDRSDAPHCSRPVNARTLLLHALNAGERCSCRRIDR